MMKDRKKGWEIVQSERSERGRRLVKINQLESETHSGKACVDF